MLIVYSINNKNKLIIKYMKNNKKSPVKNKNIKGKIGSEGGYYIDNCPVLIPKEAKSPTSMPTISGLTSIAPTISAPCS